jgi:molybdopterin synthase catalytic subunit
MIDIVLSNNSLDPEKCNQWAIEPDCGGVVHFIGTVRNNTKDKQVLKLEFEAYEVMAISEMKKIGENALKLFEIKKILIHHRVGTLLIGDIPVIISVAAKHRKPAFEACQFAIDTLKETVPIWKKEYFEDGETWVSATP